jgi:hypothetical protein
VSGHAGTRVVPALIGGALCALLGYRFTRFFS